MTKIQLLSLKDNKKSDENQSEETIKMKDYLPKVNCFLLINIIFTFITKLYPDFINC